MSQTLRINNRLNKKNTKVATADKEPTTNQSPEQGVTAPPPPITKRTPATGSPSGPTVKPTPHEPNIIIAWFQEQPLIKLGALFFFLGMAWFLGYAINEGWINPALRILLAIAAGVAVAILGHLRTNATTQYLTLTALGNAIIIASITAGQFTLELLAPPLALALLTLSIGYTVWVAIKTQAQWLAVAATVATLVAPLLVNQPTPDIPALLLFLLVASVTLITVVTMTQWRGITATLATGIGVYLLGVYFFNSFAGNLITDLALWTYTLLFAGLFLIASSMSMLRTQEVQLTDIITLSIVGFWYLLLARELAFSPGIATLVATLALASVGYIAQDRQLPTTVVAVFTTFAFTALLFGTAFLFSGMTLVLVFMIEITAALTLASFLRFSDRVLFLISCLYALPILLSFPYLYISSAWNTGVIHLPALTVLAVWAGLLWGAHWVLNHNQSTQTLLGHILSGGLLTAGYLYGVLVIFVFGSGLGIHFNSPGIISTYLLLLLATVLLVIYIALRQLPHNWTTTALATSGLPLLLSLESLELHYWRENGLLHTHALGILVAIGLLVILLSVLVMIFRKTQLTYHRNAALAIAGTIVVYGLFVIQAFWTGVFGELFNLTRIAVYTSYATLLYGLIKIAIHYRATPRMLIGLSFSGLLPILMALPSFTNTIWKSSALHPDAAGLYTLIALTILTGMSLLRFSKETHMESQLRPLYRLVFAMAGLMSVGVIWMMSGAITPTEAGGITVALFIYTTIGLFCYLWGRTRNHEELRWAGIFLIALVTIRLVLIDIWVMEVFWRIITFLGIGSLFIAAALLERQQPDKD